MSIARFCVSPVHMLRTYVRYTYLYRIFFPQKVFLILFYFIFSKIPLKLAAANYKDITVNLASGQKRKSVRSAGMKGEPRGGAVRGFFHIPELPVGFPKKKKITGEGEGAGRHVSHIRKRLCS